MICCARWVSAKTIRLCSTLIRLLSPHWLLWDWTAELPEDAFVRFIISTLTKQMFNTFAANKKLIHKIIMWIRGLCRTAVPHWTWTPSGTETITDRYGYRQKEQACYTDRKNLPIYERCIVAYEGNKLEKKADGLSTSMELKPTGIPLKWITTGWWATTVIIRPTHAIGALFPKIMWLVSLL